MKQQFFAFILILVSLFGLLFLIFSFNKPKQGQLKATNTLNKEAIIYFYGNTCPHCQELSKWLDENKVNDKVKYVKKEVYQNQSNAQELQQAAAECGLDTSSIGVPFVYAKGKCYIGSDQAKEFFQNQMSL